MSLEQRAISGAKWTTAAMVVTTALNFGTVVVLARLLSVDDFGLVGLVLVVIGFLQMFQDIGFSNAVIQTDTLEEPRKSTLFWLNITTGTVMMLVLALARDQIASLMNDARLGFYLLVISPLFLIGAVEQLYGSMLRRDLSFRALSGLDITGQLTYAVISILLAWRGAGPLSLVIGHLARNLVRLLICVVLFRGKWAPSLRFSLEALRGVFAFGAFQMGERAVNYLSVRIDQLLIGRYLGTVPLGFYNLAFSLVLFPISRVNPALTKVAFPVFSRVRDDRDKLRSGYLRVVHLIALVTLPLLTGLFLVAGDLVVLLYGDKWADAIPIIEILCLVGIVKSLANPLGSVLLALGRADIGFYWNLVLLFLVTFAIWLSLDGGLVTLAWALLWVYLPCFVVFQSLVGRLMGLTWAHFEKNLRPVLLADLAMLLVLFFLRDAISGLEAWPRLALLVGSGVMLYGGMILLLDGKRTKQIWTQIMRR